MIRAKKCKLICISFDGEYQIEHPKDKDNFDSMYEAWEWAEDIGSRWFFYPFVFIVTPDLKTVRDGGELDFLNYKRLKTVVELFKRVSKLPEAQDMDGIEYMSLLYTIWREEHE